MPTGPVDVIGVTIKAVNKIAVTRAQRGSQLAIAATQMDDQPALDAGRPQNSTGLLMGVCCLEPERVSMASIRDQSLIDLRDLERATEVGGSLLSDFVHQYAVEAFHGGRHLTDPDGEDFMSLHRSYS